MDGLRLKVKVLLISGEIETWEGVRDAVSEDGELSIRGIAFDDQNQMFEYTAARYARGVWVKAEYEVLEGSV